MKVTVRMDLVGGDCCLSEIIPWHLLTRLNKARGNISAKRSNNTPKFLTTHHLKTNLKHYHYITPCDKTTEVLLEFRGVS